MSAREIAENVVSERLPVNSPCPALPSVENMARAANRKRHSQRPKHPKDLNFELNRQFIADSFQVVDVNKHNRRHIILATDEQLDLLSRAKTWYIDGTFKVVKSPFVQLSSIHAFIKKDGHQKQVPLCFMYMSGRKKKDYIEVLKEILELLPRPPAVLQIVSDFERALWKATADITPWVNHRGCSFHWGQSVWRRIQDIGLATAYSSDESVYKYCRQLLALPFLPADSISTIFDQLESRASSGLLVNLTLYIRSNWIDSNLWPPSAWSVYGQPIRTNNDVEGWHHRLNRKAGSSGLNMYLLFQLLYHEAQMVKINMRLLSDRKVRRCQKKSTLANQVKLNRYWEEYENGNRSVSRLLQACARLYAPRP